MRLVAVLSVALFALPLLLENAVSAAPPEVLHPQLPAGAGKIDRKTVAAAVAKLGINPDKPDPLTS